MENYAGMTDEQLLAIYKQKYPQGAPKANTQAPAQPQNPQGQGIDQLLQTAMRKPTGGERFQNAVKSGLDAGVQIWGGIKPENSQDNLLNKYLETAIGEQAKSLYADPLDRKLKQKRIDAIDAGIMVDEMGNVIGKAPKPLTEKEQYDLEQSERANKNQADFIKGNSEDILSTIGEIRGENDENMKYFGMFGGLPTEVAPSTLAGEYGPRKNWEVNIDKLLSGKIVELITDMKQASKTGATGFGQLNLEELRVLQNASTALKRGLAPEDAARYLKQIEDIQKRVLGGVPTQSVQPTQQQGQIGSIVTGADGKQYRIIGGDPNDPDVEPI